MIQVKPLNVTNLKQKHIYALRLQVLFIRHLVNMTTVIAQDQQQRQIRLRIKSSRNQERNLLQVGSSYVFKYVYKQSQNWIFVRNPDYTIKQYQSYQKINKLKLNRIPKDLPRYVTAIFFVVQVGQISEKQVRGSTKKMRKLKCYDSNLIVNIILWDWDQEVDNMKNRLLLFEGFRLKQSQPLIYLSSCVFSKIKPYQQEVQSPPYSENQNYQNISEHTQRKSLPKIKNLVLSKDILQYNEVIAIIENISQFEYTGCQTCRIKQPTKCICENDHIIITKKYNVLQVLLKDKKQNTMQICTFVQELQNKIKYQLSLNTNYLFQIKTYLNHAKQTKHVINKVKNLDN